MSWEISITADGWQELRAAVHRLPRSELVTAILDDRIGKVESRGGLYHGIRAGLARWRNLRWAAHDTLADCAFDLMTENNTCDNGGYRYWIDAEGYHKVTLPDPDDEPEDNGPPPETEEEFRAAMAAYLRGWRDHLQDERWKRGEGPAPAWRKAILEKAGKLPVSP